MNSKHRLKIIAGISLGVIFLYLAFRQADFDEMIKELLTADYRYVVLAILVLMLSHYVRALRWQVLLLPIQHVPSGGLFSALTIGYAFNTLVPAHLGEFVRAYVIGEKRQIFISTMFATIVVERILDIFFLVALLLCVIFFHPLPQWVLFSGYVMMIVALVSIVSLGLMSYYKQRSLAIVSILLRPLPRRFEEIALELIEEFLAGVVLQPKIKCYLVILFHSMVIWGCYALAYFFCLEAFGLTEIYNLPWHSSLTILVVSTISIVVPSSPGYVGTFHYLCQFSLMIYGVSATAALSYATVAHAVNVLPVAVVGFVMAGYEGVSIFRATDAKNKHTKKKRNLTTKSEIYGKNEELN